MLQFATVIGVMVIVTVAVAIFFAPATIAIARRRPMWGVIVFVNVIFGVTVVGWFVALAMSLGQYDNQTTPWNRSQGSQS